MKKNILLNTQKVLTHVLLVVAFITFFYGLGFMTRQYVLFFDGTLETYEYYLTAQKLNNLIFYSSLYFILFAFLLKPFDLNKKTPGIISMILVVVGSVVTLIRSFGMLNVIPKYAALYNTLDFSEIDNYVKSYAEFNIGIFAFGTWTVVVLIFAVVSLFNFISAMKNKQLRSRSYE